MTVCAFVTKFAFRGASHQPVSYRPRGLRYPNPALSIMYHSRLREKLYGSPPQKNAIMYHRLKFGKCFVDFFFFMLLVVCCWARTCLVVYNITPVVWPTDFYSKVCGMTYHHGCHPSDDAVLQTLNTGPEPFNQGLWTGHPSVAPFDPLLLLYVLI